ncbi:MAG: hypothetical protein KME55_25845 [Nostoc indistinguendum CM1-VF10]|nr:hypothetical protein [Nostoc indistinguendum CM1-VF10]
MTYHIYSHQQLQLKSIARVKEIYSEIACTVEVTLFCHFGRTQSLKAFQGFHLQVLATNLNYC